MRKQSIATPKHRSANAKALATPKFRAKAIPSKKIYNRKKVQS